MASGEQDNNALRQGRIDLDALPAKIDAFILEHNRLKPKGVKVSALPGMFGKLRDRVRRTEPDNWMAADAVQRFAYREFKKTQLPSPSETAFKIYRLTGEKNADLSALKSAFDEDPALAKQLLDYANSRYFGSDGTLSLSEAVSRVVKQLGWPWVRTKVLGLSVKVLNGSGECRDLDYKKFWSGSAAIAVAAEHITAVAAGHSPFSPDEAFTAGLLSKIGCLALATVCPDLYSDVLRRTREDRSLKGTDHERSTFGIDHNELVARMMAEWRLQPFFPKAMRHQDELCDSLNLPIGSPERALVDTLQLAGVIAHVFNTTRPTRKVMDIAAKRASELHLNQETLPDAFDEIANNWRIMGGVLKVPTRNVPPWDKLYLSAGLRAGDAPSCP